MKRLLQLIQDNHGTHRGWVRLLLAQWAFVGGRLQRFVRSGYKRLPSENLDASLRVLLG